MNFDDVLSGFALIMQAKPIMMLLLGVVVGVIVGAIPGLTTTMGMAIFVPMTFFMPPLTGIPFLLGLYKGGVFGGSIPAILISTPGTGASIATVADGYALARNGRARSALQMAIFASFCGELFGSCLVLFLGAQATKLALIFGAAELFAILFFSLVIVALSATEEYSTGFLSLAIGLLISTIGVDTGGSWRFAFGSPDLAAGLSFISVMIGLYAFSVVLEEATEILTGNVKVTVKAEIQDADYLKLSEIKECMPTIGRSAAIGAFIGAVPGVGQPIAAMLGFAQAKRFSKHPELVGHGAIEGVAGAEAANNAVNGPALLPLLSFGIPGDVISSVLLGAFIAQGLRPGPRLFADYGDVMYALLIGMVIASFFLVILTYPTTKYMAYVTKIPPFIIVPTVFAMTIIGAYSVNNSWFDVWVMLFFGFVGFGLKKFGIPLAPMVIGNLLSQMTETNLVRTVIMFGDDLFGLLRRPVVAFFLIATVIGTYLIVRKPKDIKLKNG
jgi:putative tricarboxylic transport membrane protein